MSILTGELQTSQSAGNGTGRIRGRIIELDGSGDTVLLEWDAICPTASVLEQAEKIVREHCDRGGLAFAITDPVRRHGVQVTAFDRSLAETVLAPRLVGG